jgi:hypothetical protein
MTSEQVRLHQNLHTTLSGFSLRQLYTVARALGDELTRRELEASLEARALECALLALASGEQAKMFSDDCTDAAPAAAGTPHAYFSRREPLTPAPAEMDRPASDAV